MIGIGIAVGINRNRVFTPRNIAGLALWCDASRAETLTIDGANKVSQWNDLSVYNRHFTQGTASAQPLYVNGAVNGRAVVRTDGIDDFMQSGALGFSGDQQMSLFFVFARTTGSATSGFSGSLTAEGGFYDTRFAFSAREAAVTGNRAVYHLESYIKSTGFLNPTGKLLYNGAGTTTYGGDAATATPNYSASSRMNFGKWSTLFGENSVAEIIVYNTALSAADRGRIETYLRRKYNLW
ncbi:MAG: hypothetical protein HY965_02880 [Ignavibacteriales bacterium]|nr:hypothetical protein [Ignavibacteriales bacterium]